MKPKARKNINIVLHDIRHPLPVKNPTLHKKKTKSRMEFSYKPFFSVIIIVVILIGLGYLSFGSSSNDLDNQITQKSSFFDFWDSNNSSNGKSEAEAVSILNEIKFSAGNLKLYFVTLKNTGTNIAKLKKQGATLLFNDGGPEFIQILRELENDFDVLDDIGAKTDSILARSASITGSVQSFAELSDMVSGIADILDKPGGGRIVLLFENHSEIRPSGGFVGSYGVITFEDGNIIDITTDDIYTPDRDSELNIIPPIQLQSITKDWGARDANWFFDFPTSAEKITQFLEGSNKYVNDDISFDGVIALNSNVVSDILDVIGPIYVKEHDVTITSENLLDQIRNDVDLQREDWEPGDNPKEILGFIAPTIMERLQTLDSSGRDSLIKSILTRAGNKDLKFYFRDDVLENIVETVGLAGSVYKLPDDFVGDYLAVVNTNIAGGKSDIFIDQDIELVSQVKSDGAVENRLVLTRRHFGQNESHPWYRADNQNFTKIFTAPNARLIDIDGVTPKDIEPSIDYKDSGYTVDKDLSLVENTRQVLANVDVELYKESGKNVFAAWFITPSGEEKRLILNYDTGSTIHVEDGTHFTFVYEKQSGVESDLSYKLLAPSGFIWAETGGNIFSYENDSIPARLVFNLTLINEK